MGSTRLLLEFIYYYITAQNRHDLHSPFVFQLNENVFKSDKKEALFYPFEQLRQQYLQDSGTVTIDDFGAGAAGLLHQHRKISDICRNSAKQPRYARMLHRLVKHLQPEFMIEMGTSLGISALYQASGNPSGKLITLEGSPEIAAVARNSFKNFPQLAIELCEGKFAESLPDALQSLPRVDYVFVDGDHRYEPTLNYFRQCVPFMHDDSVMVFDDIRWSDEMKDAWQAVKSHPAVRISIDVFMMGMVFFNPGFSRQDFVIRY